MFAVIAFGTPEIFVGAFFGSILLLIFIAIVGGFLHARRNRELEHAEKMKAIEMGRSWPLELAKDEDDDEEDDEAEDDPSRLPVTLIKTVPLGALGIALGTSFFLNNLSKDVLVAAWAAAGVVGVTGLICGTLLSLRQGPAPAREATSSKPVADPDALDVVGR